MTIRLALLASLALVSVGAHAQPVDASIIPEDAPEWQPIAEAIAEAEADGKVLLLHGYASWCGWCARLDEDVYTDDDVQAYLAENFEVTRVNIENVDVIDFFDYRLPTAWLASGIGITSTPTTVFVDAEDGEIITRLPGYADRETFLYALRYVRERAYENGSFQEFIDGEQAQATTEADGATPEATPMVPLVD
ncbi:MAG: thioredoxin fold domain-containing protein [Bacteroidota bacterium]